MECLKILLIILLLILFKCIYSKPIESYNNTRSGDIIEIVGSLDFREPHVQKIIKRFTKDGSFKAPIVELTGTDRGANLFCKGIGLDYPDITTASRDMNEQELKLCKDNGITFKKITKANGSLIFYVKESHIGVIPGLDKLVSQLENVKY